jgi:hypothetical protein
VARSTRPVCGGADGTKTRPRADQPAHSVAIRTRNRRTREGKAASGTGREANWRQSHEAAQIFITPLRKGLHFASRSVLPRA